MKAEIGVDVPPGAVAIGNLAKGSAVFELPPFSRYIIFNENHAPKVLTFDGQLIELDLTPKALQR